MLLILALVAAQVAPAPVDASATFELSVSATGQVTACRVVSGAVPEAARDAVCGDLREAPRVPALDASGRATATRIRQRVRVPSI